jgi:hypothetical protein
VSNPSVAVRASLSGKPSLAIRFTQMLEAFERSRRARADRVIRRFSYLGARIPDDKQKTTNVNKRAAAVPSRSMMAETAQ